jgi:hypothetical protein
MAEAAAARLPLLGLLSWPGLRLRLRLRPRLRLRLRLRLRYRGRAPGTKASLGAQAA